MDIEHLHDRLADGVDDPDGVLALTRDIATDPERVTLPDGRALGYAETGDPDGDPLLLFHGFPNSRAFAALFDAVGRERGLRVLAPDRPGFGVSDPSPGRTLSDWPADVAAFADALGLDSVPVLGVSGGGPYALACGAELDRAERVAVAVGVGPTGSLPLGERLPYLLGRFLPPVVRFGMWRSRRTLIDDPQELLEERIDRAAPVDEPAWRGPVGRALLLNAAEAGRHHGTAPLAAELGLFGRPWDVDLGGIDAPVHLWYGEADQVVPVEMGRTLAGRLPDPDTTFDPETGHLTTVERYEDEIVDWLTE
jgi:pimeloyl-ACP methyl ester carboxylesterase